MARWLLWYAAQVMLKRLVFGGALVAALGATATADAFCGFYVSGADAELFNNATMVVLMRDGTLTVLNMQNNYEGPPQDFALVVPVPVVLQKENVKTLPREVFDRVDKLAAPRLVEYWEKDPCAPEYPRKMAMAAPAGAKPRSKAKSGGAGLGVKIEAQFKVGEYEILILSAKDSGGLDKWLRLKKYRIPEGAEPVLRPYVQQGMKFFVAKVDVKKVRFEDGKVVLSPLRFHYDSKDFSLPVRLGLLNSSGEQDLIVHILAKGQRYEVANYENVTIPTNLDVAEAARDQFGSFYTSLFAKVLERRPKSVITEYSWDAGSCDPCPTPPLRPNDLATLGADVLPSATGKPTLAPPTGRSGPRARRRPPRRFWRGGGFVLTRLHARYKKDSLGEDLVFRAAPPIAGGRERVSADGELEQGSVSSGVNNFQARYAIRHPWKGPIECENPIRGRWGGPPAGERSSNQPRAASNLGFAPPKKAKLTTFLTKDLTELGVSAPARLDVPATPKPKPKAPPTPAPNTGAAAPERSAGCGACHVVSTTGRGGAFAALFGALAALALRRRRRRP